MLEAMENSANGGDGQEQRCGEGNEEELSVLPRHTKVVVTGNNRTKSVLVGLQGVVKKAVGLGGWHWLVLTNGIERVDLSKLETTALWRYWRHFNLVAASPNPSKEQLIDVVQRHFMSQQLDELQVIVGFVHAAKRLKTVCN